MNAAVPRQRVEQDLIRAKEALEARERELSLSLSLMQATLESTADGILVTGVDGHVVMFNTKFVEIWGAPREAFNGATHSELAHVVTHLFSDPAKLMERIADIYKTPALEVLDTLELRDGRIFERFSRPQMLASKIVGRVWSYRDITAQRRIELAAREEAQMLDVLSHTGTAISSTLELETL